MNKLDQSQCMYFCTAMLLSFLSTHPSPPKKRKRKEGKESKNRDLSKMLKTQRISTLFFLVLESRKPGSGSFLEGVGAESWEPVKKGSPKLNFLHKRS